MQNGRHHSPPAGGTRRIRIKPWFVGLVLAWSLCVLLSLGWNIHQERLQILEQARVELRANFFKDLGFRRWGARHGGVYVPITEETQPDPYMAYLPERDITTPSGRILTLINPALMVKRFYELVTRESTGVQGHISSLKPLNPENYPDPWEAQALEAFKRGEKEVSEVSELEGQPWADENQFRSHQIVDPIFVPYSWYWKRQFFFSLEPIVQGVFWSIQAPS